MRQAKGDGPSCLVVFPTLRGEGKTMLLGRSKRRQVSTLFGPTQLRTFPSPLWINSNCDWQSVNFLFRNLLSCNG